VAGKVQKEICSPVNFDGERVSAERFDPENREEERSDKAHVQNHPKTK
jgi:hypothetical protein